MAFRFRAFGIGALAVASFGAAGCGGSRALPSVGGDRDAADNDAGDDDAGDNDAGDYDASGAAPDGADTSGDAGISGWPVIVSLVNAGTKDVLLPENLSTTCVFSIRVAPAVGGDARLLSATPPDTWCNCNRCGTAGRRVCDTTDPICDGPPTKLAPGHHLDLQWDGRIAITTSAAPPASTCSNWCDHWETVTPGDYVFTIETLSGAFTARAALPGSTGVIVLAINS